MIKHSIRFPELKQEIFIIRHFSGVNIKVEKVTNYSSNLFINDICFRKMPNKTIIDMCRTLLSDRAKKWLSINGYERKQRSDVKCTV